jgi:micrococcal nuclease
MGDLIKFTRKQPASERKARPAKLDPVLVTALVLAAAVAGAYLGRGVDLRPTVDGVVSRILPARAAPQGIDRRAYDDDTNAARFYFCHTGGGSNCVVDGDTFWFHGEKVRIIASPISTRPKPIRRAAPPRPIWASAPPTGSGAC